MNLTLVELLRMPTAGVRGADSIGSELRRPRVIGVDTVRAGGKPTVSNAGNKSKSPMATASIPNEVKVVQLRRVRWAHEVSNKLSSNIASSV
jgi:hypothetical protein